MPSCTACQKWGVICEYTSAKDETTPNVSTQPPVYPPMYEPSWGNELLSWNMSAAEPFLPRIDDFQVPSLFTPGGGLEWNAPASMNSTGTPSRESLPSIPDVASVSVTPPAEIPAKETVLELVDLFLAKFSAWLPCFHENRLRESIKSGELQQEAPVLVYAILAIAARLSPKQSIRSQEFGWYTNAKYLYEMTEHNSEPSLRILQAAACVIFYSQAMCNYSTQWMFLARAWRQACSLGFNKIDASTPMVPALALAAPPKDGIEKEERRRTMWVLLVFDRDSSYPTGWAPAIEKKNFAVNRPIEEERFQQSVKSQGYETAASFLGKNTFSMLTRAYDVLGRVVEHTHILQDPEDPSEYYEDFLKLEESLESCQSALPLILSDLSFMPVKEQGQIIWFHILLHTATIILNHRSQADWAVIAGIRPKSPSPESMEKQHFQRCVLAASAIVRIVKGAMKNTVSVDTLLNPHLAPALYLCTRILNIKWHDTGEANLRTDAETILLLFHRLADLFPLGQKFINGIQYDLQASKDVVWRMREAGSKGVMAQCTSWTNVHVL